jgi:hypothetical protein
MGGGDQESQTLGYFHVLVGPYRKLAKMEEH